MQARSVDFIGSLQGTLSAWNRRGIDPAFRPDAFSYDSVNDTYQCPAGKILTLTQTKEHPGRTEHFYNVLNRLSGVFFQGEVLSRK